MRFQKYDSKALSVIPLKKSTKSTQPAINTKKQTQYHCRFKKQLFNDLQKSTYNGNQ